MKKIFLTVSLCALFAAGAFAQGMSGGVKAGLNLANFSGDDVGDTDMRIAYHIGGFLNFSFSDALSLQPELLYNSIGAKADDQDGDMAMKMNYISIPVSLIYSFGNFNIQAGPQFSFLASAKAKYTEGDVSADVDMKEYFKGTDLGVNIGLGAAFGKLHASARYYLGLTDIPDSEGDANWKNTNIQLSLGYALFGK
ncbi:MAG: porin family protein [Bacteroidota bacterium]|jgi:hypothetical protein